MKKISDLEFITIMAWLMAVASLSIDALLPGLNQISSSIGITNSQDTQLLIMLIFLWMWVWQLISWALSDSIGRKPVIYIGYATFVIASFICIFAVNLEMMLVWRFLQWIGLSAPRTVSMSIIRDKYSGNHMAKIMSFIMVIFTLVPILAPSLWKLILDLFNWQAIFYSQIIIWFISVLWFWFRQDETLKKEDKKEVKISLFKNWLKEFFKHRSSVIYTVIIWFMTAPFLTYISASQQIFEVQYGLWDLYPYIFSGLAIVMWISTFLNWIFVMKFGMFKISITSIIILLYASAVYLLLYYGGPNPDLLVFIWFMGLILFFIGFIIGNLNALAMQPIWHIAGIWAAIIWFASTIISVIVAGLIGSFIESTTFPIFISFIFATIISLFMVLYDRNKSGSI